MLWAVRRPRSGSASCPRPAAGWALSGAFWAYALVFGGLVWTFREPLLSIYITDSLDAIAFGTIRLTYISLPYFVCGLMDVTTGALRGLGKSFAPMVISVLGICGLRIVWIYTIFQIPQFHTPDCLYLSYLISWVITFAIQMAAFIRLYRRQEKESQRLLARGTA